MNKSDTWSPCSYDLAKLAGDLPNGAVISAELQDQGYDYDLMRLEPETTGAASLRILLLSLFNHLLERNLLTLPLAAEINRFFHAFGAIVDQTYGPALAQLQVVVRKNPAQGEAKQSPTLNDALQTPVQPSSRNQATCPALCQTGQHATLVPLA